MSGVRLLAYLGLLLPLQIYSIPGECQISSLTLPNQILAGHPLSLPSTGSGKATLYIVGPSQVLEREFELGHTVSIPGGTLVHAGRYLAILVHGSSYESGSFDVLPLPDPAHLSFLARPSRLPVDMRDAISGAVYVFDAYHNLILLPRQVSFQLFTPSGGMQTSTKQTRYGAAWARMNSTAKQGVDTFVARVDGVVSKRVVEQVPGSPCGLTVTASRLGERLLLKTRPVRDCSGNPVPDGTIVTFNETYDGYRATADVPLKHGVAQIQMPARNGAVITVASGVSMGNEIHWEH